MQRKTIGSFIAALRKANGLTQKDLAEKLNVSDKTVSRWERDESAPEIGLIPVISEIFNITSDELLRGERSAATDTENNAESRKTDKQCARILAVGLSRFKSLSLIAAGLAICGFIAAMLCNIVFLRAYLGFFIGAAFYAAAIITQLIFTNHAFLAVSDSDISAVQTGKYKHSVIKFTEKIIVLTLAFAAICAPLLLAGTAYAGVSAEYLLPSALLCAGLMLAACGIAVHFINNALLLKGVFSLSEKQENIYKSNFNLRQHIGCVLSAVLVFTALFNFLLAAGDTASFAEGTVFNDYASFQAYMAQEVLPDMLEANDNPAAPVQSEEGIAKEYRDEHGNIITEDEALTREICNEKGEVVCEYIWRNRSVISVSYGSSSPDMLPIKTITSFQMRVAQNKISLINFCFLVVYIIEILLAAALYLFKRERA